MCSANMYECKTYSDYNNLHIIIHTNMGCALLQLVCKRLGGPFLMPSASSANEVGILLELVESVSPIDW